MRGAKASILLRQRDYRASLVERGGEFVDLRMSYDTGTDPSALLPLAFWWDTGDVGNYGECGSETYE